MAKYREALAIIQSGKDQLARLPREDMNGCRPGETDRRRDEKNLAWRAVELRTCEAIRNAAKVYDAPPATPEGSAGAGAETADSSGPVQSESLGMTGPTVSGSLS